MSMISWPFRWIGFIFWYIWALITSNMAVIKDLLTPGADSHSGIARVATNCRTDAEVTLLAALITLTPGTLTLGTQTTEDGVRWIYVHSLFDGTADAVRQGSLDMEAHMLQAMRREGFRP